MLNNANMQCQLLLQVTHLKTCPSADLFHEPEIFYCVACRVHHCLRSGFTQRDQGGSKVRERTPAGGW